MDKLKKILRLFRLPLIDRYIFSEFVRVFLGTVVLLTGILLISQITDNLKGFLSTKQPQYHIGLYILFSLPKMMIVVIPPSLMFSVCFVIGQFNSNKELVSIMAAGVSFYKAVRTIFVFGTVLTVFVLFFSEMIVRPSNSMAAFEFSVIEKGIGTKKDLVYQLHIKGSQGFYYLYWYDHEKQKVSGGFNYLKLKEDAKPELVISAQSAQYLNDEKVWKLDKVEEIGFTDNLTVKSYKKFPEKKQAFPEDPTYFAKPMKSVEEMNFLELGREISMRQSKGMPYGELEVERNVILANPLMCLLVVFIGAVIGAMTPKGGAIVSLTYTILFVLVYYVFFSVGKSLGENGGLHPIIAVWLTPTFFLSMCFYLYKKFNM